MGMIKLPQNSIEFFKQNLDDIFSTGAFAEGKWNEEIVHYVKEITQADYALPTNSNGAGMVALLTLYRHYYGRTNVLIQSNTMYGVKTMVYAAGCNLIEYIECQIESLMPSITDVQYSIEGMSPDEKNKAVILLSHIGGIINPDIEEIAKLCKKENIILLEDCAHSFGATLHGKHSGLFGDAGVYSFYATKAIPVGEGGVVVTNNNQIGEMVSKYSIYDRFDQKLEVGSNFRVSEVQALLIYSAIKEYKSIINNKIPMAEKYMKACLENNIQYIAQNENGQFGNYYKFIIITPNVNTEVALPNLKTKTSPVYDYDIGAPNSVALQHACLPIWYSQSNDVVEKAISELQKLK